MTPVFIVARRVQHETVEGRCDVAVHFQRADLQKPERESDFTLVFGTHEAHLARQFPLGARFVMVPEVVAKQL